MFVLKKCYQGNNSCPQAQQLPLGVLAPNSSNQSRAMNRSSLIRNTKGAIVIPDGTTVKTGIYYAQASLEYVAPYVLATIFFALPFKMNPTMTVVVDDCGNDPAWVVHIRNLTTSSFDLVLKNANKPENQIFAVYWTAYGTQ